MTRGYALVQARRDAAGAPEYSPVVAWLDDDGNPTSIALVNDGVVPQWFDRLADAEAIVKSYTHGVTAAGVDGPIRWDFQSGYWMHFEAVAA